MSRGPRDSGQFSPYNSFDRVEWARLRDAMPQPLSELDLDELRGINEQISLDEVTDIYLPLARLINMYVKSTENLYQTTNAFLGQAVEKVPFIIGIAGSVAVGKSTTSRILQALLHHTPGSPKVDLVTTDGFLYPNRVLEARGLMSRKGFPESYDVKRLMRFVADVKSGFPEVKAPVYSHVVYDIVDSEYHLIRRPDIMILEGLNVLQTNGAGLRQEPKSFVSDFFDFSIYVDASESDIKRWYMERFKMLRQTAFLDKRSYFHRYATMSEDAAEDFAQHIWQDINGKNLLENIWPTRYRAQLILEKGAGHAVQGVKLRKL